MYRGFSSQCLLNVFKSEPTKYFNDYGVDMSTIGSHATFLFYFLIYFGVDMSMVVLHISKKAKILRSSFVSHGARVAFVTHSRSRHITRECIPTLTLKNLELSWQQLITHVMTTYTPTNPNNQRSTQRENYHIQSPQKPSSHTTKLIND